MNMLEDYAEAISILGSELSCLVAHKAAQEVRNWVIITEVLLPSV